MLGRLAILCVLSFSGLVLGTASPPQAPERVPPLRQVSQLARGRSIFALRCAVCHGETGGGLEEARLAFPEDHRRCESCHKPGNPRRQADMLGSFETMRGRVAVGNAFSIGSPPPLRGQGVLPAFENAAALQRYIRAAMPRHAPGSLNGEQSYALTAFILELNLDLNRALPTGAEVNRENAKRLRLR